MRTLAVVVSTGLGSLLVVTFLGRRSAADARTGSVSGAVAPPYRRRTRRRGST